MDVSSGTARGDLPAGGSPVTALVIGYGNTLCADDGVGPRAADLLAADARVVALGARVLSVHQLTPELAADVAEASVVVFIDASADASAAPGSVAVRAVEVGGGDSATSHHVGAGPLIAMASELYGWAPETWIVSVGVASLELGEPMTPVVEAALLSVVEAVVALLR